MEKRKELHDGNGKKDSYYIVGKIRLEKGERSRTSMNRQRKIKGMQI